VLKLVFFNKRKEQGKYATSLSEVISRKGCEFYRVYVDIYPVADPELFRSPSSLVGYAAE